MSEVKNTTRWYVVHVHSGAEQRVAQHIREQADKKGLVDEFQDIMVPTEDVVEIKRGERVNVERQYFPGYILLNMVLTDESWHLVSSVPKVTGFLGGRGKPTPITKKEVERLMSQIEESKDQVRNAVNFIVGEEVKVNDGPFATFTGIVEEVEPEKERLKVSVTIFGRSTPVELEYAQVEKV